MSTLSVKPAALLDALANNLPLTTDQRATLYTLICDAVRLQQEKEARDAFDTLPDDYEIG